MEAGLETRFDGNPLHFRILTGYAGLCRQQCPFQGRGVPGVFFRAAQKHQILPSPPERGRGVGGEGASHPCRRKQIRESGKESTPTTPCGSSVKIRVHPWLKNIPRPRSSVAQHNQLPGGLHPSPPSPLPFQGRGVPCAISTAAQKHKVLPSPPERGRGVGGEGDMASMP